MAVNTNKLKLKFNDECLPRLFSTQADTNREFIINITDEDDNQVDITGMSLDFFVGNDKQVTKVAGTIKDGKNGIFIVKAVNSQFKYPGLNKAQFILSDGNGGKIGSQLIDLWVEESIENGATVGQNVIVDFETIKTAVELIKNYEKTFEESKMINVDLKESISTGVNLNIELKTSTSKANSVKKSLDGSINKANSVESGLDSSVSKGIDTKTNLDVSIKKAETTKTNLDGSIDTAKKVKVDLDGSIKTGREVKSTLDTTIETGQNTNTAGMQIKQGLDESIAKANTSKTNLDSSISNAKTAKTELDGSISQAKTTKTNLDSDLEGAKKVNAELTGLIGTSESLKSTLDKTIETGREINSTSADLKTALENENLKSKAAKEAIEQATVEAEGMRSKLNESTKDAAEVKVNLEESVSTAKKDLDTSVGSANIAGALLKRTINNAFKSMENLTNTNRDAKTTLESLKDSMTKVDEVEKKIQEIIKKENLGEYVTHNELTEELAKVGIKTVKVDSLPQTGDPQTLYLVKDPKGKNDNIYLEYLWIDGKFELIGSTQVDLSGYVKTSVLESYAKTSDLKSYAKTNDLKTFKTEDEIMTMILEQIGNLKKGIKPDAFKHRTMTAIIDQSNPDPLTCVSYADDAETMTKGSAEWDDFFGAQLVLFKDGKEVRKLNPDELDGMKAEDGDVMVRFKRMGLNIKTEGDKVYVSMTDNPDDPNFKYYAHSRGDQRREAFYIGAYSGSMSGDRLRSITGAELADDLIGELRTAARKNGEGYELFSFYQLTFMQALYVLKYGALISEKVVPGYIDEYDNPKISGAKKYITGQSNKDKAIDSFEGGGNGLGDDYTKFQYIEGIADGRPCFIDGISTDESKLYTTTDNFNDKKVGYKAVCDIPPAQVLEYGEQKTNFFAIKTVQGNSEAGFIGKESYTFDDFESEEEKNDFVVTLSYGGFSKSFCAPLLGMPEGPYAIKNGRTSAAVNTGPMFTLRFLDVDSLKQEKAEKSDPRDRWQHLGELHARLMYL